MSVRHLRGLVMLALGVASAQGQALYPPKQTYEHGKVIEAKHDRFKGLTTVLLKNTESGLPGLDVYAFFLVIDTIPGPPPSVVIGFTSSSESWLYLKLHAVAVLVDGKPMTLQSRSAHDGSVGRGHVMEFVNQSLTREEFLRIANATKVEFRVGPTEGEITPNTLLAFKDLASRMMP